MRLPAITKHLKNTLLPEKPDEEAVRSIMEHTAEVDEKYRTNGFQIIFGSAHQINK